MAAKNTLKYKRNRKPPLLEYVNNLIEKCLNAIQSQDVKATMSGLVQLIRLRLKIEPLKPGPQTVRWVESLAPMSPAPQTPI
jgi:hypothetical protein